MTVVFNSAAFSIVCASRSSEFEPMDVGTTSQSELTEEVTIEALAKLARKISTRTECTRLAGKLGFEARDILHWNRSADPHTAIARDIFVRWRMEMKSPRRSTLARALMEISREDLADFFNTMCQETAKKEGI